MWERGMGPCGPPALAQPPPACPGQVGGDSRHGGRCRPGQGVEGGRPGQWERHWGAPFRGFLGRWFETLEEPQLSSRLFLSLKITMCRSWVCKTPFCCGQLVSFYFPAYDLGTEPRNQLRLGWVQVGRLARAPWDPRA